MAPSQRWMPQQTEDTPRGVLLVAHPTHRLTHRPCRPRPSGGAHSTAVPAAGLPTRLQASRVRAAWALVVVMTEIVPCPQKRIRASHSPPSAKQRGGNSLVSGCAIVRESLKRTHTVGPSSTERETKENYCSVPSSPPHVQDPGEKFDTLCVERVRG